LGQTAQATLIIREDSIFSFTNFSYLKKHILLEDFNIPFFLQFFYIKKLAKFPKKLAKLIQITLQNSFPK
jgi:hypothetical protein